MDTTFAWDDEVWDEVWERNLDAVERHDIAMAVLRRRLPSARWQRTIAVELARRWRRQAVTLGSVYAAWTLFWSALAWDAIAVTSSASVQVWCSAVGLVAVAACIGFRRRLAPLLVS